MLQPTGRRIKSPGQVIAYYPDCRGDDMDRLSNGAGAAVGCLMLAVGFVLAFVAWLGFGGISEADDGIPASPLRVGFTFGFLGLGAAGLVTMPVFLTRALWDRRRRDPA
jgi:hypothetical protein